MTKKISDNEQYPPSESDHVQPDNTPERHAASGDDQAKPQKSATQDLAESKTSVTGNVTGNKKPAKPKAIYKHQQTLFDGAPRLEVDNKPVEFKEKASIGGSDAKTVEVQNNPEPHKTASSKTSVRPAVNTMDFILDAYLDDTPQPDGTHWVKGKLSLLKEEDEKSGGGKITPRASPQLVL